MTDTWEYGEAAGRTTTFPWPPASESSALSALGETWRAATFDPGAFFAGLPRDAGTGPALLYYLVVGMLVAGATLFWETLSLLGGADPETTLGYEAAADAISPLVGFLLAPAILLVALGVSAAAVHGLLAVLGGARHGFGTTVRVFCYAYSPMLFGVVPVLGTVVGTVWMVVLAVIGLRNAHATEGWKAGVAVALPFVVLVVAMVAVLALLFAGAALLGV